jgi:butyrate kinase
MKRFAPLAAIIAASVAQAAEIPVEKNSLGAAAGHPLTSVVVTQCNLIVTVYVTMPDGRLLRFDKSANVPADQLLAMAYTATRSERVEVACEANGVVGYEKHEAKL